MMRLLGLGMQKDGRAAVSAFERSAEAGHAKSLAQLALMYEQGNGVVPDRERSLEYWKLGAEAGDAGAQYMLSLQASNRGDSAKRLFWLEKSAAQGFDFAQFYLGEALFCGLDVEEDKSRGTTLIALAAKQGHQQALSWLDHGSCHLEQ